MKTLDPHTIIPLIRKKYKKLYKLQVVTKLSSGTLAKAISGKPIRDIDAFKILKALNLNYGAHTC